MYDMVVELSALNLGQRQARVDSRFSQLTSDDWIPMDVTVLRAYEWDRINFAPERIERFAEIWGMQVEQINEVRRRTRRNLFNDSGGEARE